jgi:hypothetical protein
MRVSLNGQKKQMNAQVFFSQTPQESITWVLEATPIQVKLWNFQSIAMVLLHFSSAHRQDSAAMKAEELKQANVDDTATWVNFELYCFDEDIVVEAVRDLFLRAFQNGRHLVCLVIELCTGRVDEILHVASALDMFDEIVVASELSQHGCWSISAAMKFNKRLTKLDLSGHHAMTREQAAALGAGLITFNSQHFKELRMSMPFADGAITELASGLKKNTSLCSLTTAPPHCDLRDAELAELIDAVESHPTLKVLSLGWNYGGEHALVALGKVLASKSCQLERLDFSNQGRYYGDRSILGQGLESTVGRGLELLAQGLQWNESLTSLNLSSSNNLVDTDIDHLGKILATCKLQTLNLSGNSITYSGLVSLTQNIPGSLKSFSLSGNAFSQEEAASHTLALLEEHPQLWEDGFNWEHSISPTHQKIQHFKDLNRCGRILLAGDAGIPLSVWPIVLERANTLLDSEERTPNVMFYLLQGPALMQRRFDGDSSQAACVKLGKLD